MARALLQAPFASFHTPSPSGWADGFSVREQVEESRNAEQRVVGELIETATSPQELFQLSQLHVLNSNEASLIITQLSRLVAEKKLERESILRDERFQQLVGITDSQVGSLLAALGGKNARRRAGGAPGVEPAAPSGFYFAFPRRN